MTKKGKSITAHIDSILKVYSLILEIFSVLFFLQTNSFLKIKNREWRKSWNSFHTKRKPRGKRLKRLPLSVLFFLQSEDLNPFILAIWFMDDGGLGGNTAHGLVIDVSAFTPLLCTSSLSNEMVGNVPYHFI